MLLSLIELTIHEMQAKSLLFTTFVLQSFNCYIWDSILTSLVGLRPTISCFSNVNCFRWQIVALAGFRLQFVDPGYDCSLLNVIACFDRLLNDVCDFAATFRLFECRLQAKQINCEFELIELNCNHILNVPFGVLVDLLDSRPAAIHHVNWTLPDLIGQVVNKPMQIVRWVLLN